MLQISHADKVLSEVYRVPRWSVAKIEREAPGANQSGLDVQGAGQGSSQRQTGW